MKLILNSKTYNIDDIISSDYTSGSPVEESVFSFVQDWFSEKETFTIHTSGSTGTPKPVLVSRKQMEYSARQTLKALNLEPGDTALLSLNPDLIAGKMMMVRAFVAKMDLIVVPPSSNPLNDLTNLFKIDFVAFVPLQVQTILDVSPERVSQLESMKAVIIGGAPISPSLLTRIKPLKGNFYATYGMTETLSHIALKKLNGEEATDEYVALEGVTLSQDERGCLTINSPVTLNETIVTNDVVEITGHSSFRWIGRADFIINSGGVKIAAEVLEEKASKVFLVQGLTNRFIFAGQKDDRFGEKVVLIIEGVKPHEAKISELHRALSDWLLKYEQPKEIIFLDLFPETSSGKINRLEIKSSINK